MEPYQQPSYQQSSFAPQGQHDLLGETDLFQPEYAGFWLRFAAVILDGLIIWAAAFAVILPLTLFGAGETMLTVVSVLMYPLVLFYYPIMESSRHQATFGKKALGLMVTDEFGEPISFGKSFVRNIGKILSAVILYIGYMMAGFTDRKQALHDILAKTLVIKK